MRQPLSLAMLLLLVGCTSFPQLDAVISEQARRADYPVLIPATQLLGKRSDGTVTEQTGATLLARAANLRRRAALLRGQSIDEATRLRLAPRLRRLGG